MLQLAAAAGCCWLLLGSVVALQVSALYNQRLSVLAGGGARYYSTAELVGSLVDKAFEATTHMPIANETTLRPLVGRCQSTSN